MSTSTETEKPLSVVLTGAQVRRLDHLDRSAADTRRHLADLDARQKNAERALAEDLGAIEALMSEAVGAPCSVNDNWISEVVGDDVVLRKDIDAKGT